MKKFILFITLFIGLSAALAPLVEGYLFKKVFYQFIENYQQEILAEGRPEQLKIASYNLGWLESTVNMVISKDQPLEKKYHIQPIAIHIKSVIHHGPLIKVNNEWQFGYANIQTNIYLPDILKIFVHESDIGFMQINTQVTLDGNIWKSHYSIPSGLYAGWDGLSGDVVINTIDYRPTKITSNIKINKSSIPALLPRMPEINIGTIYAEGEATRQSLNIWNGSADLTLASLTAIWRDGSVLGVINLSANSNYGSSRNDLFNYNTLFTIDSIQLPPPSPFSNVTRLSLSCSINNLNANELRNHLNDDDFMKILTLATSSDLKTSMNTELGTAKANLHLSLASLPKAKSDLAEIINVEFSASVAQLLLTKTLASYLVSQPQTIVSNGMTQPVVDQTHHAELIINDLLKFGYILQEGNNYTISFIKKGQEIMLNSKTMSKEDMDLIPINISQALDKATSPAAPTVTSVSSVVAPASNNNGYNCYWMENTSGKYRWILVPYFSKSACFSYDSCNGGLKRSGGGCYKWATSPDGNASPWDQPAP